MEENQEKKSKRGGARANSGRKKAEGERHTYTISADVALWIKEHGEGSYLTSLIREIIAKG